jgi:hypothetical protein
VVAGAAGAAPSAGAPQAGSSFWQPQDGALEQPQLEHESQLEQLEQQPQPWNNWPNRLKPQPPQHPHALACNCKPPTDRQTAATTTSIRFIKARFMKSPSKPV